MKDWLLNYDIDLETKIVVMSIASSDEGDMMSKPFIIVGTDDLSLFRNWFQIFQDSYDPSVVL